MLLFHESINGNQVMEAIILGDWNPFKIPPIELSAFYVRSNQVRTDLS